MTDRPADPLLDHRHDRGPFDIVGDVHGCADELIELMERLGYTIAFHDAGNGPRVRVRSPAGRRMVFVGDLIDRGPRTPDALRIAMAMVESGQALCVPGNHDVKLLRWLQGRDVKPIHGFDTTLSQMRAETHEFHAQVRAFIDGLPFHLWLDGGNLVVAHAGIREEMIGTVNGDTRRFCLYGDTDGVDVDGLPIRYHWAAVYDGRPSIVYGHTPIADIGWVNNTLCIDTACCFGGSLTALRWPERELVSVPARKLYSAPRRPFGHPPLRPVK